MFKSSKRAKKKKNATPVDRLRTQVTKLLGGVAGRSPQKGKTKTRAKAKNVSSGTRRSPRAKAKNASSGTRHSARSSKRQAKSAGR